MRRAFFPILLFLIFSGSSFGQSMRIHGIVTDSEGVPIPDAWIQDNGRVGYLTITDSSGYYSVIINFTETSGEMLFVTCSSFGYQDIKVPIDTAFQNLVLYPKMGIHTNSLHRNYPASLTGRYYGYDPNRINGSIDYYFEFNHADFSGYRDLLDSTNITSLGKLSATKFDVSLMLQNYMLRIGYGSGSDLTIDEDSVSRRYKLSLAGIELGFSIPIGSHIMINYLGGICNYRYRMVNKFSNGDVSLTNYLKKPEIDLRFNQPFVSNRLELGYRTNCPVTESPVDFYIAFFTGFNSSISRSTLVCSRNSRLLSDQSIGFDRFIYGLKMAVIIKNRIH